MEFKTISKECSRQFFSSKDLYVFLDSKIINPFFSLTKEYLSGDISPLLLIRCINAMNSMDGMLRNPLGLKESIVTKSHVYVIDEEYIRNPVEDLENFTDDELKSFADKQFKELCKRSDILSFSDNYDENIRLILEKMNEIYTYCNWCLDSGKDFWGREIALSDNEAKYFFSKERPMKEALRNSKRKILNLKEILECTNDELKKAKEKIAEYENEEDKENIPLFRELRDRGHIREIQDSEKTYGCIAYRFEKMYGIGEVLDKYKTYSYAEIQRTKKLIAPKTGKPYTLSNLKKKLSGC